MIRFEHPKFLYLLFILPVLVLIFYLYMAWKRRSLLKFGDFLIVSNLVPNLSGVRNVIKFFLFFTAVAMIIFGMANPQIGSKLEEVKRKGVDLVIALDVSNSMMVQDIKPNRLTRAKMAISRLIDRLEGDRLGIIVFAGKAFTQLPITHDHAAAKMFLESISTNSVNVQGTAIGAAISQSMASFQENNLKNKAIIIISDGENHEDDPISAAEIAVKNNIVIHTIGMGSPEGAPIPVFNGSKIGGYKKDRDGNTVISKLDEQTLRRIASIGNGSYTRATNIDIGLDKIFDGIKGMEKQEYDSKVFSNYESRFQYFIAFAVILLILEFFISDKKSKWLNKIKLFEINKINKLK